MLAVLLIAINAIAAEGSVGVGAQLVARPFQGALIRIYPPPKPNLSILERFRSPDLKKKTHQHNRSRWAGCLLYRNRSVRRRSACIRADIRRLDIGSRSLRNGSKINKKRPLGAIQCKFTAKNAFVPAIGAVGGSVAESGDKTATRSIGAAEVVGRASAIAVTFLLHY